jgi:hypothetical protein
MAHCLTQQQLKVLKMKSEVRCSSKGSKLRVFRVLRLLQWRNRWPEHSLAGKESSRKVHALVKVRLALRRWSGRGSSHQPKEMK